MTRHYTCSSYTISGLMPGRERASRHPLPERLTACQAAGYDGLWLHYRDYLEQRTAGHDDYALRAMFDEAGMNHRGIEFLTDWFLDSAKGREAETACLAAATAIGASVISVGGDFGQRGIRQSEMIERFVELCSRAADADISVALEFVPWSNIPDIATAVEYLEADNAGLMVDCWHLFRGGMSVSEISRIPRDRILAVQVNDADAIPAGPLAEDTLRRRACGDGAFDLPGFARALDATGTAVHFSVEIISPEFVAMTAADAARFSLEKARAVFG
ncbi:MAG: sugar phosphate isomerase/epimerase [Rhizobiaceae bacterium]|nr:sugar phosphate isomerase/epimerase [Rhizobiaceae bacterium]